MVALPCSGPPERMVMLVSCSACSAKFQLPDDKIVGRKARMKCKACGAAISIDGTGLRPSAAAAAAPPLRPSAAAAAPPPPPRRPSAPQQETLSFNDQTVALGAEAAEALSSKARLIDAAPPADLEDRVTPISNPRAAGPVDQSYVDLAMDALERKVFSVPAPKPVPQAKAGADAARSPSVADDEEATRMMDLPRLLSGAPADGGPPSSRRGPEEATRMVDTTASSARTGKRAEGEADEATRIFDADPAPRGPRLPPRPSLPRPHGPAPSSQAVVNAVNLDGEASRSGKTAALDGPPVQADSAAPLPHTAPLTPAGSAGSPAQAAPAASTTSSAEDGAPAPVRPPRPPPDLTVQRARLSPVPIARANSSWGLYLFAVALAATGALLGAFFFARPTFDRAIVATRSILGLGESGAGGSGPAFNAAAASAELARVAGRASTCKQEGGPTGAGRARVLFQVSGVASSAAISPPFHASASEACLLTLFKSARVPPFGGHPVIVTKTFRVD